MFSTTPLQGLYPCLCSERPFGAPQPGRLVRTIGQLVRTIGQLVRTIGQLVRTIGQLVRTIVFFQAFSLFTHFRDFTPSLLPFVLSECLNSLQIACFFL